MFMDRRFRRIHFSDDNKDGNRLDPKRFVKRAAKVVLLNILSAAKKEKKSNREMILSGTTLNRFSFNNRVR